MNKKITSCFDVIYKRYNVEFPKISWVFCSLERILMFGFGLGLIRIAPGTWGTFLAWMVWLIGNHYFFLKTWETLVFLFLFFFLGCWCCERISKDLGNSDHISIIWDEMVSFWLILYFSPKKLIIQLSAFIIFRIIDSLKPPPIKFFEKKLEGGIGIMLDDVFAALYTGILLFTIF